MVTVWVLKNDRWHKVANEDQVRMVKRFHLMRYRNTALNMLNFFEG